jgi:hypothetical protein
MTVSLRRIQLLKFEYEHRHMTARWATEAMRSPAVLPKCRAVLVLPRVRLRLEDGGPSAMVRGGR